MTLGSLFDGIGGFPLAAIKNAITPIWASEIEAAPVSITKFLGLVEKQARRTRGAVCLAMQSKLIFGRFAKHDAGKFI